MKMKAREVERMKKKIIIVLDERKNKDWQDIAQEWCDIGREQGRTIYVRHKGCIHTVIEEVE